MVIGPSLNCFTSFFNFFTEPYVFAACIAAFATAPCGFDAPCINPPTIFGAAVLFTKYFSPGSITSLNCAFVTAVMDTGFVTGILFL